MQVLFVLTYSSITSKFWFKIDRISFDTKLKFPTEREREREREIPLVI